MGLNSLLLLSASRAYAQPLRGPLGHAEHGGQPIKKGKKGDVCFSESAPLFRENWAVKTYTAAQPSTVSLCSRPFETSPCPSTQLDSPFRCCFHSPLFWRTLSAAAPSRHRGRRGAVQINRAAPNSRPSILLHPGADEPLSAGDVLPHTNFPVSCLFCPAILRAALESQAYKRFTCKSSQLVPRYRRNFFCTYV